MSHSSERAFSLHTIKTQHLLHTKLAFEILESHYGQLKSCSGLDFKNYIQVQAGPIDSDCRGELKVLLSNESDESFSATHKVCV